VRIYPRRAFFDGRGDLINAGERLSRTWLDTIFPMMVGSIGGLGYWWNVLQSIPRPQAYATWHRSFRSLEKPLNDETASMAQIPLSAGSAAQNPVIPLLRMAEYCCTSVRISRLLETIGEVNCWKIKMMNNSGTRCGFSWVPEGYTLIKAALTPRSIPAWIILEATVLRRYAAGGPKTWIALTILRVLEPVLKDRIVRLVIWGPGFPHLGELRGISFLRRVKESLDPAFRFTEV
jgi:hypothetical protein